MKTTRIIATNHGDHWLLTATIINKSNQLDYQQRFDHEPSEKEIRLAVKSFENNYSGLNESNNKSVKVKKHHSES